METEKFIVKSYKDLNVYNLSFQLSMDIFMKTRSFPKEEIYSLTSQVVRSSRSISANIVEGWAKRAYPNIFRQHLITSLGSTAETENWLLFAKECNYISEGVFIHYSNQITIIGKMITNLHKNWKKYEQ